MLYIIIIGITVVVVGIIIYYWSGTEQKVVIDDAPTVSVPEATTVSDTQEITILDQTKMDVESAKLSLTNAKALLNIANEKMDAATSQEDIDKAKEELDAATEEYAKSETALDAAELALENEEAKAASLKFEIEAEEQKVKSEMDAVNAITIILGILNPLKVKITSSLSDAKISETAINDVKLSIVKIKTNIVGGITTTKADEYMKSAGEYSALAATEFSKIVSTINTFIDVKTVDDAIATFNNTINGITLDDLTTETAAKITTIVALSKEVSGSINTNLAEINAIKARTELIVGEINNLKTTIDNAVISLKSENEKIITANDLFKDINVFLTQATTSEYAISSNDSGLYAKIGAIDTILGVSGKLSPPSALNTYDTTKLSQFYTSAKSIDDQAASQLKVVESEVTKFNGILKKAEDNYNLIDGIKTTSFSGKNVDMINTIKSNALNALNKINNTTNSLNKSVKEKEITSHEYKDIIASKLVLIKAEKDKKIALKLIESHLSESNRQDHIIGKGYNLSADNSILALSQNNQVFKLVFESGRLRVKNTLTNGILWQSPECTSAIFRSDGLLKLYLLDGFTEVNHVFNNKVGNNIKLQPNGELVMFNAAGAEIAKSGTISSQSIIDITIKIKKALINGKKHLTNAHYVSTSTGVAFERGCGQIINNNNHKLYFQSDGNVALLNQVNVGYRFFNKLGQYLVFQDDANLVLYDANLTAVWQSGKTSSNSPFKLGIQSGDYNLIIHDKDNGVVWDYFTQKG